MAEMAEMDKYTKAKMDFTAYIARLGTVMDHGGLGFMAVHRHADDGPDIEIVVIAISAEQARTLASSLTLVAIALEGNPSPPGG